MHRAVLVLILYALPPTKSEWKKIKLEYKQLMKFLLVYLFFVGVFLFCFVFVTKWQDKGKKPMFLFIFLNFMLWKEVYTSMHAYVCMSDLLEWQGRKWGDLKRSQESGTLNSPTSIVFQGLGMWQVLAFVSCCEWGVDWSFTASLFPNRNTHSLWGTSEIITSGCDGAFLTPPFLVCSAYPNKCLAFYWPLIS